MDGLEDRLSGLHKRLDDLDNKPRPPRDAPRRAARRRSPGRCASAIDGVDSGLRDRLDDLARGRVRGDHRHPRGRPHRRDHHPLGVRDAGRRADQTRLEAITARLDEVGTRLDGVESGLGERVGALSTSVEHGLDRLDGTLVNRPDHEAVVALVRQANEESERRNAGHLDEAMATFAEIILGPGGGSSGSMPAPRPTARRGPQVRGARRPGQRRRAPDRELHRRELSGSSAGPAARARRRVSQPKVTSAASRTQPR